MPLRRRIWLHEPEAPSRERRGTIYFVLAFAALVLAPLRAAVTTESSSASKAASKSASEASAIWTNSERMAAATKRVQDLVDDFRTRLSIPQPVIVSFVPKNPLLVSVGPSKTREGAFALTFEYDFVDLLRDEELGAVVAHELGHVWIFTHHPYLQTEELANHVALRAVSRETLDRVYQKVWAKTGAKGDLAYFPDK